jgi:hypothetical protein
MASTVSTPETARNNDSGDSCTKGKTLIDILHCSLGSSLPAVTTIRLFERVAASSTYSYILVFNLFLS